MTQEATVLSPNLTLRVSSEIRAELGRQQMSQRRLSELVGMQPAVFSKRITGTKSRTFTLVELDLIAEALGVPVDQLFGVRALAGAA